MIEEIKGGVRLHLFVQPKASKNEIIGPFNGAFKIRITAPPLEGRANDAVIEFLSEIFKTAKRNVLLVKGDTHRHKTVDIVGVTLPEAKMLLKIDQP